MSAVLVASPAVEAAYHHCQELARREARNFYFGFVLLPPEKRRAIYAAYAFSRHADDIVDEAGSLAEKVARLAEYRARLDACLAGHPDDPTFVALTDAVGRFGIPGEYLRTLLDGVEMDLRVARYQSFDELARYCYAVASVVGLISLEIFGYEEPQARQWAAELGMALQLTNILRDLREDAARDRVYLPQDELARFGYPEERLVAGVVDDAFRRLMAFQVARARHYYQRGRHLLPLLDPRSRACVGVLEGIYARIVDEIEARGYDVFSQRVSLSSRRKLGLMGWVWTRSVLSGPRARAS